MGGNLLPSPQTGNVCALIFMERVNKRFMVPEQKIFRVEEDESSKDLRNAGTSHNNLLP
jgi:hypothetical protein